jgi:hypothetical protein
MASTPYENAMNVRSRWPVTKPWRRGHDERPRRFRNPDVRVDTTPVTRAETPGGGAAHSRPNALLMLSDTVRWQAVLRAVSRSAGAARLPRAVVAARPFEDHGHPTIGQRLHFCRAPVAVLRPVGHHDAKLSGVILDRMLNPVHRTTVEYGRSVRSTGGIRRHVARMSDCGVAGNGNSVSGPGLTPRLLPDLLTTDP